MWFWLCERNWTLIYLKKYCSNVDDQFYQTEKSSYTTLREDFDIDRKHLFPAQKRRCESILIYTSEENELFVLPLPATGKFLHLSSLVFRFRLSHVTCSSREVSKKWLLILVMNDAVHLSMQLFQAICHLRPIHLFGYT